MPFRNFGAGGTDTSDATAGAENIEPPYTAYVNGVKVTGTMNRFERAAINNTLTIPSPPTVSVTLELLPEE
jgi:hypothetical protein